MVCFAQLCSAAWMEETVSSYNHLSVTKMLSILFNSFLWKIIVRELFFLLIFQSVFSLPYVYSLKQRLGERATFVFLTELSIAGSFLFPCLVLEERWLHMFLGLFNSQWLTETHHVWVCQAEIESSVAQTVEISE